MPGMRKGKWGTAEDELLRLLCTDRVCTDNQDTNYVWAEIAAQISAVQPNNVRTAKQYRVRWFERLSPDINRSEFTKEEDEQAPALHKSLGNKWAAISPVS
jgi:hypothetical protein